MLAKVIGANNANSSNIKYNWKIRMEGNGKKLEYAAITLVEKEAERRNKLYTIVIEEASAAWRNFYTNHGFFSLCAYNLCNPHLSMHSFYRLCFT